MSEQLLSCPHCGHKAEMEGAGNLYSAVCIYAECGARGPYAETVDFATQQWNRRAVPPGVGKVRLPESGYFDGTGGRQFRVSDILDALREAGVEYEE